MLSFLLTSFIIWIINLFNLLILNNKILNADAPTPWELGFQDGASPGYDGIVALHDSVMFYLILILVSVFWVMLSLIRYFNSTKSNIVYKYLNHGTHKSYVPFYNYSNNLLLLNKRPFILKFLTTLYYLRRINSSPPKESALPVKTYTNVLSMKKLIMLENQNKSGIYRWVNKLTGDIYVGQSINLSARFKNYLNLSYLKSKKNLIICIALTKYGFINFSLEILEYCDIINLLQREQYYLDLLNPKYNILKIAGSSLGYKHSLETKLSISKAHGNPVDLYEKNSIGGFTLIGKFTSARKIAKFINISGSTVLKYMRTGNLFKNKYKFLSANEKK